eukprot:SM000220S07051  [mRNA]  locus=s220:1685:2795:- [translate_table: standard]
MPPGAGWLLRRAVKQSLQERQAQDRQQRRQPQAPRQPSPGRSLAAAVDGRPEPRPQSQYQPRSFPHEVKLQCWDRAETVPGRDPQRWRRDAVGNTVFRKLVACDGCLCYDYDHIVPYSKGGPSTLDNCQILQTAANRAKGDKMQLTKTELVQKSAYCRLSGKDMDTVELISYGDVIQGEKEGCRIQ